MYNLNTYIYKPLYIDYKMKIKDVEKKERRERIITIRISNEDKMFLKNNNISVSRLFRKAIEDLKKNKK